MHLYSEGIYIIVSLLFASYWILERLLLKKRLSFPDIFLSGLASYVLTMLVLLMLLPEIPYTYMIPPKSTLLTTDHQTDIVEFANNTHEYLYELKQTVQGMVVATLVWVAFITWRLRQHLKTQEPAEEDF